MLEVSACLDNPSIGVVNNEAVELVIIGEVGGIEGAVWVQSYSICAFVVRCSCGVKEYGSPWWLTKLSALSIFGCGQSCLDGGGICG